MTAVLDPSILARALGYPYPAHPAEYLFRDGRAEPLATDYPLDGLTPVIAVGSNRAPDQLARKYAGWDVTIPVTRHRAHDVDVVYAAHMASYGAIPATLAASPGTVVELWITWLDEAALARMDATEAVGVNYDRFRVSIAFEHDERPVPASVLLYVARRGLLRLDEQPIALAAIPAEHRRYEPAAMGDLLRRVHARHGGGAFEDWLAARIGETGRTARQVLVESLAADAHVAPLSLWSVDQAAER
ncbi:MAG: hypothetical protein HQ481_15040 [Alphaproteobacteria bacterium]|nr:hypothetical protein [Alphaproteobacteria bacterium]